MEPTTYTTALSALKNRDETENGIDVRTLKRALWEKMDATICADAERINVINLSYGAEASKHVSTVTVDNDGVPIACSCKFCLHTGKVCKHQIWVARQPMLVNSIKALRAGARRREEAAERAARAMEEAATMADRLRTDGGSDEDEADAVDAAVSGPHVARDGSDVYTYWICERCGLETTDSSIRLSCWRCEAAARDAQIEIEAEAAMERRAERAFEEGRWGRVR